MTDHRGVVRAAAPGTPAPTPQPPPPIPHGGYVEGCWCKACSHKNDLLDAVLEAVFSAFRQGAQMPEGVRKTTKALLDEWPEVT